MKEAVVRTLDVLRLAVLRERAERHVRQSAAHACQRSDRLEAHQRVHDLRRKSDMSTKNVSQDFASMMDVRSSLIDSSLIEKMGVFSERRSVFVRVAKRCDGWERTGA